MNWKFTRKRHKVRFEKGEPICRILPYPRHYLRKFEPRVRNINQNAGLYQQYVEWRESRLAFNEDLQDSTSGAAREKWQRSYMKGQDQQGNTFSGHETKLQIKPFKRD